MTSLRFTIFVHAHCSIFRIDDTFNLLHWLNVTFYHNIAFDDTGHSLSFWPDWEALKCLYIVIYLFYLKNEQFRPLIFILKVSRLDLNFKLYIDDAISLNENNAQALKISYLVMIL